MRRDANIEANQRYKVLCTYKHALIQYMRTKKHREVSQMIELQK